MALNGNGHDHGEEFPEVVETAGGFWNGGASILRRQLNAVQQAQRQAHLAAVLQNTFLTKVEELRRQIDQARTDFIQAMEAKDYAKAADAMTRQTRAVTRLTALGVEDDAQ